MIRIGILGAARIAPKAVIHPASVRGDVKIQAVAARELSRAQAFAEKYSERNDPVDAFDSYQAVIDHPAIDLVYNPLPINLHAEWTIKALEAGKHVLCEKPFAMNTVEAEAMLAAAEKSGKRVIEAFHFRYHPAFQDIMDSIEAGDFGEIKSLNAVFNVAIPDNGGTEIRHLPETGGGSFMDLGCYPLSWALMVMGETPTQIEASATLTERGVDETMQATLTFANGASAELSSSMAPVPFSASLHVEAERGSIAFINPLAPHMGAKLTLTIDGEKEVVEIDPTATYVYQLDAVATALLHDGDTLPTEGNAIPRQQQAIDAIYEAAGLRALRYR